jgi:hypothetical protein
MFDTLVRRVLSSGAHSETTESPDQTNWLTDNDVLGPPQDLRAFFFTCMILKQTSSFVLGRFCRSTYEQEYASRPTLPAAALDRLFEYHAVGLICFA